jgi:hypothetical protein
MRRNATPASVWVGSRFPAFLLIAAVIAGAFQSNAGFICASGIGSAVGVSVAALFIFRLRQIRLSWILGDGLLLGYSLGTFNTCVQLALAGTTASVQFSRTQEQLSIALTATLLGSAFLFVAGGVLEKPIHLDPERLMRSDLRFVWLGLIIVAAAFATGGIGYMGTVADDQHRVSTLGEIAGFLGTALPAMTVFLFPKCRNGFSRIACWILIAASLVALIPQGRRALLYSVLLAFVAYGLSARKRRSIWKSLLLIAVAVPFLYVGNVVFYALRVAAWQGGPTHVGLGELTGEASSILRGGHDANFDRQVDDNLRDRTFVLRYFSDLLDASWTHTPLYGADLLFSIKLATPAILYPNKEDVRQIGMEEMFVNPEFGLYPVDEANSIFTTGVSDFGALGVFIYPIGLALLMNWFLRTLVRYVPEIVKVIAVIAVLDVFWQTEVSFGLYLVLARDLVIMCVPLVIMKLWEHGGRKRSPAKFEASGRLLRYRPTSRVVGPFGHFSSDREPSSSIDVESFERN